MYLYYLVALVALCFPDNSSDRPSLYHCFPPLVLKFHSDLLLTDSSKLSLDRNIYMEFVAELFKRESKKASGVCNRKGIRYIRRMTDYKCFILYM